jgi:two-component sensor histidine kinase
VPGGRVLVRTRVEPGRDGAGLRLTWTEQGGPPVQRPRRTGFGAMLVTRLLVHGRDGSVVLDWRPEGLECRIDVPLVATPAEDAKAA